MSKNMSVKDDLKCVFNMPAKLSSQFGDDEEESHGLPPYAPSDVYSVDEYEACPTNWMHGSDTASSYFIGVKEDHGMWLDFNECFYHTHDVAVVISIQGINPITGQKMVAEKALRLEQYHKKCPIHNTNYKQDRYCEKCGFKWPGQNYLSTTGTPEMMMWLDGFRTPEGKVRQYIFTEDKMKGVASQLIGEERVFAIGIAYYLSKNKKLYTLQRPQERDSFNPILMPTGVWNQDNSGTPINQSWITTCCDFDGLGGDLEIDSFAGDISIGSAGDRSIGSCLNEAANDPDKTIVTHHSFDANALKASSSVNPTKGRLSSKKNMLRGRSASKSLSVKPVTPVKKFEIGAGALIKQRVYDDPKMIDYWEERPAGLIYINYCDEETQKKILDAGRRADKKDGFMKDIKIGG